MQEKLLHMADTNFWSLINDIHKNSGGAYKIIAVKEGKCIPINRFLDTDYEGILYIGKATCFTDRLTQLKKAISPDYSGSAHICGRRYKKYPTIAKQFPFEIMFVDLLPDNTPEVLEKKLLNEYSNRYGEVPPLNAV